MDDWPPSTPEIQGFHSPQVYRMDIHRYRHPYDGYHSRPIDRRYNSREFGRKAVPRHEKDGGRSHARRPERPGHVRDGPQGRYARPDHNRRPYDPEITCAACKRRGHTASNCDMVAMALFLERYVKKSMSQADRDKIEAAWLQRWKKRLGNPSRMPCKVMKAYLEYMDISPEMLDTQMDWESWLENDDMEDIDVPTSTESPLVL
jgi:hypothetical protein